MPMSILSNVMDLIMTIYYPRMILSSIVYSMPVLLHTVIHAWQIFLRNCLHFKEQLGNPKLHVTRQLLYEEYKAGYPHGYGKSQFFFHLQQNLIAQKDCTAVLTETYNPGEKLMVDFAGDKLSYIDIETGEIIKVEVFVACMPYSDYTYVICVPSQKQRTFCLLSECVWSILVEYLQSLRLTTSSLQLLPMTGMSPN